MSVATVYLVGIDQLDDVPGYLEMGAVVVVAPDRSSLRQWQTEWQTGRVDPRGEGHQGVVVDLARRLVLCDGHPIELSNLEFEVFAALMSEPLRAWSFRQLGELGWEAPVELRIDIYPIRALIQRLRVKLRAAEVPVNIQAVRGFGFRCESAPANPSRDSVSSGSV